MGMRILPSFFITALACIVGSACERAPAADTPAIAALAPGIVAIPAADPKADSIRIAIAKANAASQQAIKEAALKAAKGGATPVPVGDMPAVPSTVSARAEGLLAHADRMRTLGSPDAKVWMIMVSDFQCPWCAKFERETWPAIRDEYVFTGKVRVAFLNYPMPAHRNSWAASEVAMCTAGQPTGKFWPIHDAIFREQEHWETESDPLPKLFQQLDKLGMPVDSISSCVKQHLTRPLIQGDIDRATRAGASSTPTFFIGGTPLIGAASITEFRKAIDAALAKVDK